MKVVVQTSESAIKTLRLLSNLTIKNIVRFIQENGPSPPSKIARGTGISFSTASRCLQEMLQYNIVRAKWETKSIDERPLKVYSLVPNVLRFEYVLNEPDSSKIKPSQAMVFKGSTLIDFKEGDKRGAYATLEGVPFRFDGLTAEILKEISKGGYTVGELRDKFKDSPEEFKSSLKHLMTLGVADTAAPKD